MKKLFIFLITLVLFAIPMYAAEPVCTDCLAIYLTPVYGPNTTGVWSDDFEDSGSFTLSSTQRNWTNVTGTLWRNYATSPLVNLRSAYITGVTAGVRNLTSGAIQTANWTDAANTYGLNVTFDFSSSGNGAYVSVQSEDIAAGTTKQLGVKTGTSAAAYISILTGNGGANEPCGRNNVVCYIKVNYTAATAGRTAYFDNITITGNWRAKPTFTNILNWSITDTTATINFTSNIWTNATIGYSTTSNFAVVTNVSTKIYGFNQSLTITGLTANTRYFWNITQACDDKELCGYSPTQSYNFTTGATPDTNKSCVWNTTIAGNWNINCSDSCLINTNFTIPGNLTLYDSGTVVLNATINFSAKVAYLFMNQTKKSTSTCILAFTRTGKFANI